MNEIILVLGLAGMITSTVMWKEWLASNERMHGHDVSIKLSEQETKRQAVLVSAMAQHPFENEQD